MISILLKGVARPPGKQLTIALPIDLFIPVKRLLRPCFFEKTKILEKKIFLNNQVSKLLYAVFIHFGQKGVSVYA